MHTSSVVLLPGTLCDQRLWQHQVAQLGGERAVLVGNLTHDSTVAAMASRVLAMAPAQFALAGLSLGGIVALEILRQAPARVSRLALLDSTARPPTAQQLAGWQQLAARTRAGELAQIVTDTLLPALIHPDRRTDRQLTDLISAMAANVGAAAYLRQLAALAGRADSRPALGQIDCPTLLLVGNEDSICPPALAIEMASAIPAAQLVVLANCGHLSSLERPAAVTEYLGAWLHT